METENRTESRNDNINETRNETKNKNNPTLSYGYEKVGFLQSKLRKEERDENEKNSPTCHFLLSFIFSNCS